MVVKKTGLFNGSCLKFQHDLKTWISCVEVRRQNGRTVEFGCLLSVEQNREMKIIFLQKISIFAVYHQTISVLWSSYFIIFLIVFPLLVSKLFSCPPIKLNRNFQCTFWEKSKDLSEKEMGKTEQSAENLKILHVIELIILLLSFSLCISLCFSFLHFLKIEKSISVHKGNALNTFCVYLNRNLLGMFYKSNLHIVYIPNRFWNI